jgi:Zn-dependent protease with chaperone function
MQFLMTPNELAQAFTMMALMAVPFYFQKWVKTNPHLRSLEINARCSRLTLVILGLMFFSLFTESGTTAAYLVRHSAFIASIFSFGLLYWFRGQATTSARQVQVSSRDHFERSVRSIGALLFSYGAYLLCVRTLTPFITSLPAVIVGLVVVVSLSPIMARILFEAHRMEESALKDELAAVFKQAKIPMGEIYLMNTDRFKLSNAMVCGSRFGFGPLKRSLFLTKNLFEVLEPAEVKAVVAHEASHFQLNHIPKRMAYAFAAMIISAVMVVTPLTFFVTAFTSHSFRWHSSSTAFYIVASIAIQLVLIHRVIRRQEFEADLHAVVLGAHPEALISALEKITLQNSGTLETADSLTRLLNNSAHPTFFERREALRTNIIPSSAAIFPPLKWVAPYAIVLMVMTSWMMTRDFAITAAPTRSPASPKGVIFRSETVPTVTTPIHR